MKNLIEAIVEKNFAKASSIFENRLNDLIDIKLEEFKREYVSANLSEGKRFRIVRVRIRKGKVQRRKKVSNVKGFTFRGGRMVRMSVAEKRHRKMGQRRGKIKRRSKRLITRMHYKRALRRRHALGLK